MDFGNKLKSGDILFREMEKMFSNLQDTAAEMKEFGLSEKMVTERNKQISQYRLLNTSVKGALVILEFREKFRLNGDFGPLEMIKQVWSLLTRVLLLAPLH